MSNAAGHLHAQVPQGWGGEYLLPLWSGGDKIGVACRMVAGREAPSDVPDWWAALLGVFLGKESPGTLGRAVSYRHPPIIRGLEQEANPVLDR